MPYLIATDKPLFIAASMGANIIHAFVTEAGGKTGIPAAFTVASDTDENAFLGAVANAAGSYKPLPTAGAWLEAGEIYGYGTGLVIIRQYHTRTEHAPADIPALMSVYRAGAGVLEWVANEKVYKGLQRTYGGKTYNCLQDHTTQVDWQPDKTPTLWAVVPTSAEWAYPVAYKVGDVVTYQGKSYQCLQAHTSQAGWNPVAVPALWKLA